ncbi:MAG: hypothetical protein HC899_27945 [Leptolyngbyaceae cyanobacterium SM1_4_3]|nr:hypothetical protein [Leptolyngbyaceae cyanobacterium SM1_4_3]NJO66603.1 hypothetical protein [Leptolyngbyaceae cyanobacterium RM1_405_57]
MAFIDRSYNPNLNEYDPKLPKLLIIGGILGEFLQQEPQTLAQWAVR